jgi:ferredoxin
MQQALLKKIRVVLSLLFLGLTIFIFIDFAGFISAKLIHAILFLQFIPSLLEFIQLVSLAAAGFVFIVILTLFFGRVYCSTICPLGTLQDIFIRFRRFRKRKIFRYQKPLKVLQYSIVVIVVIMLLFNNILFLNLLDPFSLAGKIFTNFFRPVYYGINNAASAILTSFHLYYLYPVTVYRLSIGAVVFTGLFSITIVLLSIYRGRWFCNAICPVGTTLGLLSKFSIFKIRIDEKHCTSCGMCLAVCKSGCIDYKEKKIDFERCVACFDCLNACPEDGIGYSFFASSRLRGEIEHSNQIQSEFSRRNFIKTTLIGIAGGIPLIAATKNEVNNDEHPRTTSESPVTPPGAVSIWHYTQKCTACHLCVSVCPTKVLQPAFLEFGLTGLFQPRMDFHTNYCNFECTLCSEICPAGAILPVTKEQKKTIQIGVSKFIKNICVVVDKHTQCGACSEHCPTKAVEMVPWLDNLKIPKVDEKICVGCGACEYACPTKPEKAIYVESNLYHHTAMKPLKKVEGKLKLSKPEDDFPF